MKPVVKRLLIASVALAVTLVVRETNHELWQDIGWIVRALFLALIGIGG